MPSEFETVITSQTAYGTIITAQGAEIIADCILSGKKLPIVEAAAGDGGGGPTAPYPEQIALVNERWRGAIAGMERNPTTPNMLDVKIVIGEEVGGFVVREMGLFSDAGALIAVCNTPAAEKVAISSGVSGKLTMVMHIVVADASVLDVVIQPSLDTVSRQDVEETLQAHNGDAAAHPELRAQVEQAQETAEQARAAVKELADGGLPLLVIGETEPEKGPVFWFDTRVREPQPEVIVLQLGGEGDEAPVVAEVDGRARPVTNAAPTGAEEDEIYEIEITD